MNNNFLFDVFIFLAAACIIVPLASRFKLGSTIGYLLVGILIGPFGFKLIGNAEQIMKFAGFGVIMMLFLIGLELEPAGLWRMRKAILGLGSLQIIITGSCLTFIGIFLGFDWHVSFVIAMALSLSSTALVLQLLHERNLVRTSTGELSFALLLFQDITVIPLLIIIPLFADHEIVMQVQQPHITSLSGFMHALVIASVIAAVIIFGHYFSHYFFYMVAQTNLREVFTATSLALIIGVTLLMQTVGVSPGLGAFLAGVVLANSAYKRTLETDIEPFKGLLLGLFFISVGISMNFGLLVQQPLQILSVLVLLIIIKALILFLIGCFFNLTRMQAIGFALALSQGSEFAFVLLQFAHAFKVIPENVVNFFTLVVALSMATTPFLILCYRYFIVPRFLSILPPQQYDVITEQQEIILAGYGRFGQVIGRFLNAQGIQLTILEKDPEQIEFLRRFGFKGYFGDASRLDFLKNAGAGKAKLFIIAIDDADASLEIAKLVKAEFPHLKIYARARNRRHAYELYKIGVNYYKREVFDSALTMAQKIMRFLGHDGKRMRQNARTFLKHDEASLKKSFEFFEKEAELINFSRQSFSELERILREDQGELPR